MQPLPSRRLETWPLKPGEQHLCGRVHMALALSFCLCSQQPPRIANQTTAGDAEPKASSSWDCLCKICSLKIITIKKAVSLTFQAIVLLISTPTFGHNLPWNVSYTEQLVHLNCRGQALSNWTCGQTSPGKPDFAHSLVSPQITHGMTMEKDEHL